MIRSLRCLVLIISITSLGVETGFSYQEEVDWIWNDVKPTARQGPACMKFIVKAYPIKILRGKVSGHACLESAIESFQKAIMKRPLVGSWLGNVTIGNPEKPW